jgi:glycogen synthase
MRSILGASLGAGRAQVRIALATSSYAPYIGGVEEHVRNVARVLRDRGHDVVVWTVDRSGGFGVREVDGIEVWDLPAPLPARSVGTMIRLALRMPVAFARWRKAFRAFRPDLIHVHCFGPNGTYARVIARRNSVPMIVTSHGETLADDHGVFQSSRFAQDSLRRSLATAAEVTACSHVVLDDLVDRFGLGEDDGVVVPNGIDLHEAASALEAGLDSPSVAAIGRIEKVKGFDLLLDAFLAADLPGATLVIAGDGEELPELRRRVREADAGDRVRLPGRMSRGQVTSLLRQAEVIVVPSRFEAFGIVVLEAWRAHTPVIATTHGGPKEFVTEGVDGMLCDPLDTRGLADAIAGLLDDEELRSRLAESASLRVRSFTWENVADQYERIYSEASTEATVDPASASRREDT